MALNFQLKIYQILTVEDQMLILFLSYFITTVLFTLPKNVLHTYIHLKIFTFIWTGYCTSVIKVCTLTPKFCTTFTAWIASGKKELSHYNNSEQCPSRFLDWMGIPEFSFSALSFAKNFMVPEFHFIVKLPFFLTTSTIRNTTQGGQIIHEVILEIP